MTEETLIYILEKLATYLVVGAALVWRYAGKPRNTGEWIAAIGITVTWPVFFAWGLVLSFKKKGGN